MNGTFPEVYCVLLNWNSGPDTIACVEALELQDYPCFRIVLVDNASTDGSEDMLHKKFPQYSFIQTGKNLGYGWGNNFGIRRALGEGAEFVWIINPDVRISKKTLSEMIRVMRKNPRVGICAPAIIEESPRGIFYVEGAGFSENSFYPVIHKRPCGEAEQNGQGIKEVESVIGCSMLVRSQVFIDIGMIREDFFMYHEELEFNFRAKGAGWERVICRQVRDYHRRHLESRTPWAQYYMRRNAILISRIHRRYILRTSLKTVSFQQCKSFLQHRELGAIWNYLKPVWDGLWAPLRTVPKISQNESQGLPHASAG